MLRFLIIKCLRNVKSAVDFRSEVTIDWIYHPQIQFCSLTIIKKERYNITAYYVAVDLYGGCRISCRCKYTGTEKRKSASVCTLFLKCSCQVKTQMCACIRADIYSHTATWRKVWANVSGRVPFEPLRCRWVIQSLSRALSGHLAVLRSFKQSHKEGHE